MMILSKEESLKNKDYAKEVKKSDLINVEKFNSLEGPVSARTLGGGEYWITLLDVLTGCMHIDVCGQTDVYHFSDISKLIDINGNEFDPDDFYIE